MNDGELAAGGVCTELLAGIRRHRQEFEAAGDRAEELRTLPPDTVQTLRRLGVFWVKTPEELGGTPLTPLEFCDVIEELAYTDTSTAWAAMIGATAARRGTAGEQRLRGERPLELRQRHRALRLGHRRLPGGRG